MKRVFNNKDLCHRWANQHQDYGRSSTGALFFRGKHLYSYGEHYALGYADPLRSTVIMAYRDYSVTTAKHRNYACSATSNYTNRIWADQAPKPGDLASLDAIYLYLRNHFGWCIERIKEASVKAVRARSEASRDSYFNNVERFTHYGYAMAAYLHQNFSDVVDLSSEFEERLKLIDSFEDLSAQMREQAKERRKRQKASLELRKQMAREELPIQASAIG